MPAILFSFLPPYRVLMVWVYERTNGSLLVAMLMHASLVAFWIISTPVGIAGMPLVTWYLVWAAVLWVVVGAVSLAQGGPPLAPATAPEAGGLSKGGSSPGTGRQSHPKGG